MADGVPCTSSLPPAPPSLLPPPSAPVAASAVLREAAGATLPHGVVHCRTPNSVSSGAGIVYNDFSEVLGRTHRGVPEWRTLWDHVNWAAVTEWLRGAWTEFCDVANPYTLHTEELTAEEAAKQAIYESFEYYKSYPAMYMEYLRGLDEGNRAAPPAASLCNLAAEIPALPSPSIVSPSPSPLPPPLAASAAGSGGLRPQAPSASVYLNSAGHHLFHRGTPSRERGRGGEDGTFSVVSQRIIALRWLLHVFIGIAVGLMATAVAYGIQVMEEFRLDRLYSVVVSRHFRVVGYFFGYLFHMAVSAALVLIAAAAVVYFEPAASGGGIPDVIAYLNGVQVPKAVNLRTFIAKAVSCMCAVAGGLPVGSEAPLIHLGAITGAGVTQGRSRTLGFQTNLFRTFRNNKDRRDFITAGAACGVSAAFGAPIGGLLFVMEEVSSFWDHSASGQIFLATMICFTTVSIVNSVMEDERLLGWVTNAVSVLFEVNVTIPLNLISIVPSCFLGILCGALAAAFTKVNLLLIRFRRRRLKPFKLASFLEPAVIALLYGTIMYFLALFPHCVASKPMLTLDDGNVHVWGTENTTRLLNVTCSDPNTYSPAATLYLGTGKSVIRHLFTRQTAGEFPAFYVLVFFVVYTIFACWSSGTSVSGGLVVPSLVVGAAFGRLYGLFLWAIGVSATGVERGYYATDAWMDPGLFALIGAGAFLAGTSRMTMSICVIMVELSSELHYLLPVMVAIVMSKTVADFLSEPLYHEMLHLTCVPYLPQHLPRPEFEQLTAADVMQQNVVMLRVKEKTSVVLNALRNTTHNAFPVVMAVDDEAGAGGDSMGGGTAVPSTGKQGGGDSVSTPHLSRPTRYKFVGLVTREDVQVYLALPQLRTYNPAFPTRDGGDPSMLEDDGFGGKLPLCVSEVSLMSWHEWTAHKTSLFFALGDKKWQENWSRSNIPQPDAGAAVQHQQHQPPQQHPQRTVAAVRDAALRRVLGVGSGASASAAGGELGDGGSQASTAQSTTLINATWGGTGDDGTPVTPGASIHATEYYVDERQLPPVVDLSLIVNRSPWVIPPFFNLQMAYHTFRMMGLRHMVVVDGDSISGIITRKDLLVDALRRKLSTMDSASSPATCGAPDVGGHRPPSAHLRNEISGSSAGLRPESRRPAVLSRTPQTSSLSHRRGWSAHTPPISSTVPMWQQAVASTSTGPVPPTLPLTQPSLVSSPGTVKSDAIPFDQAKCISFMDTIGSPTVSLSYQPDYSTTTALWAPLPAESPSLDPPPAAMWSPTFHSAPSSQPIHVAQSVRSNSATPVPPALLLDDVLFT